jgi:hypothetical protein
MHMNGRLENEVHMRITAGHKHWTDHPRAITHASFAPASPPLLLLLLLVVLVAPRCWRQSHQCDGADG